MPGTVLGSEDTKLRKKLWSCFLRTPPSNEKDGV